MPTQRPTWCLKLGGYYRFTNPTPYCDLMNAALSIPSLWIWNIGLFLEWIKTDLGSPSPRKNCLRLQSEKRGKLHPNRRRIFLSTMKFLLSKWSSRHFKGRLWNRLLSMKMFSTPKTLRNACCTITFWPSTVWTTVSLCAQGVFTRLSFTKLIRWFRWPRQGLK